MLRFAGHLPHRIGWVWSPCDSFSVQVTGQGTNLLGGKPIYLKVGIPQSMVEGPELKAPPSGILPSIPMANSIKATLPKAKRGQHDHGREGALNPDSIRHVGTCVDELNPKETKSHGHTHTFTPQTWRSLWSSGHIIPGGCTR